MSIEEALEALRAADPADGIDPVWQSPAAVDDVPRRRPVVVLLAAAAAVLLIAGIAAAVAVGRGSGSRGAPNGPLVGGGGPTSAPAPTRSLISPGAPDPNPARTRALLGKLLDGTPSLARAVRVPRAPVAVLRSSSSSGGDSTHEIRLTRWFTAPGSVSAASRSIYANPPTGTTRGDRSTAGDVVSLDFYEEGPGNAVSSPATVEVDVVAYRGGVAVRVDAYAFWLPSRTTDSIIGVPDSAVVTVTVTGRAYRKPHLVNRHLAAGAAARLAREIDDLPGGVEVVHGCPPTFVSVTETLVFSTARGTYLVRPTTSRCGETTELRTPTGHTYPLGLGTLFADVLSTLGLPQNYGQR